MVGCASPFPPAFSFAKTALTANSFLSCPASAIKPAANSPHFFLILVAPFYCSRLHFRLLHLPAKRASLFLPLSLASRAPPSKFLARAWISGSRAVYFLKSLKPLPKADGSLTGAAMKPSRSPGGERRRTIAPLSLCACAVR